MPLTLIFAFCLLQFAFCLAPSALCLFPPQARARGASDADRISAVLLDLSSALEESSAARFLDQVDRRRCPDYAALEESVVALLAQFEVGSSVGVSEQTKNGDGYDLKLDWMLELKPASGGGASRRRRDTVNCRIEPSGKRWTVTRLEPAKFFSPL